MMSVAILLLVGAAGGFLAGLLGIGGGLVFVPALYFVLSGAGSADPMLQAVATSLAAATVTGLSSARAHAAAQRVNWSSVKRIAPAVAVGGLIGAWLVAAVLNPAQLQNAVALLLLAAACFMLMQTSTSAANVFPRSRHLIEITSSLPIGVASVVMGIAGGTWLVPMQTAIGVPVHRAVATAAVVGVLLTVAGAGFMIISTQGTAVRWAVLVPLCVTSVLCAPFGARMAHKLPAQTLRRLFGGFLILTSLLILGDIK